MTGDSEEERRAQGSTGLLKVGLTVGCEVPLLVEESEEARRSESRGETIFEESDSAGRREEGHDEGAMAVGAEQRFE